MNATERARKVADIKRQRRVDGINGEEAAEAITVERLLDARDGSAQLLAAYVAYAKRHWPGSALSKVRL